MIITTVTQVLINRIDLGMTLPEAVAAPRASQRNTVAVAAEPAFLAAYQGVLTPFGHTFTSTPEIGAVAAIEVGDGGLLTAAAEPVRRGGGTGLVVRTRTTDRLEVSASAGRHPGSARQRFVPLLDRRSGRRERGGQAAAALPSRR